MVLNAIQEGNSMNRFAMMAAIALSTASSPAIAATSIAFTFVTVESDYLQPKAAGVITRQYSGTGNIVFNSDLTTGVYGIADIASFALNLRIDALISPAPNLFVPIFADFKFGLADLNSFSITYNGGAPVFASFSTKPVVHYQSTPNFTPAPASIDFTSSDSRPLAINAYLTPNVKTTFAKTGIQMVAVPEPASWTMMIAGFGVLGGALRRRSTRSAHAA